MKGSTLLFEPLPIARLGVRRDDDAVVMGTDFSSFGYLLEEFVSFGALRIAIPKSFPEISAMVSLFDVLVNDPQYVEYSEAVAELGIIHHRNRALSRIRTLGRAIAASDRMVSSWDFVAKTINAWSGVPIRQSSTLSSLVSSKSLPTTVNLQPARERALKMWRSSADHNVPYNRSGYPFQSTDVDWLPPLNSASAPQSGATYLSLGTVGELVGRLQDFENARGRCD